MCFLPTHGPHPSRRVSWGWQDQSRVDGESGPCLGSRTEQLSSLQCQVAGLVGFLGVVFLFSFCLFFSFFVYVVCPSNFSLEESESQANSLLLGRRPPPLVNLIAWGACFLLDCLGTDNQAN